MEYREYAEYREYIASLQEQIHDRRAKRSIVREIDEHIESQCAAYEAEGMPRGQAVVEAIRQMGSPVEVGAELNKIHRPRTPRGMMVLAAVLMLMGVVMQSHIFWQLKFTYKDVYLYRSIVYNLLGFVLICGMLFADYNFFGRYASRLYLGYLAVYLLFLPLENVFHLKYTQILSAGYYLALFFPILLAGLVYQNRGRGVRGLVRCVLCSAVYFAISLLILPSFSGLLQSVLICGLLMGVVLWKDIFRMGRRKARSILGGLYGLCAAGIAAGILWLRRMMTPETAGRMSFRIARLMAVVNPEPVAGEEGYIVLRQRAAMEGYQWLGGRVLPYEASSDQASTYIISSILSWYGVMLGIVVVGVMLFFGLHALRTSLRQSNRLGQLLGCACSISLLVRICMAMLINLGYFPEITVSVPFLGYGLGSTLFNSLLTGIILCVYRNANILCEMPDEKGKERWRLRLTWVKE